MISMSTHHLDKADHMKQICLHVNATAFIQLCVYNSVNILVPAVEYQWFFLVEGMQMSIFYLKACVHGTPFCLIFRTVT